jgi:hypothetical protein
VSVDIKNIAKNRFVLNVKYGRSSGIRIHCGATGIWADYKFTKFFNTKYPQKIIINNIFEI